MIYVLIAFQMINGGLQYKPLGAFEGREDCLYALRKVEPAFDPEIHKLICIANQELKGV